MLDELDHLLVTALQIAPRADWRTIGEVLDIDASTVARRWARLTQAGHAWIGVHPAVRANSPETPALVAFIEVDCVSGRLHEVAGHIADDPHVFNLEHVSGSRDLLVTAVFTDHAQLARYVGFRLGALDGVAASRTQVATTLHTEGSRWRLDRLTEEQRRRLAPAAPSRQPTRRVPERDLALVRVLGEDPRRPVARIAERTGLSPTTVRRRLDRLDAEQALSYRCEVARSLSGWPVSVSYWGAVPQSRAPQLAKSISQIREIRLCASLTGPHNLLLAAWLRSVDDIGTFESRLAARHPELTVADRAITLWPMKLAGHLLDPQGRHLRAVPLSSWLAPESDTAEASLLARLRTPPA
ncbi:Lrp/AsnC family transcriptional regulator [Streptomyces sp. ITFR-16]|uniref:Lrp/AsnC family transcriptional regulator n=1 Tax=Streptomyces sp. ITFR-16 TaxID=3075198 RepID=UPI00288BAF9C|nr:Lrp/AsnC family transcriptional regulator [Streptomyces sp. ITFR-16]WNI26484.1 Lrp/AsnC family transcriptional regulator [Streptomyces sp. ITFR-16]